MLPRETESENAELEDRPHDLELLFICCFSKFAVSFASGEVFPLMPIAAQTLGMPHIAVMAILAAQPLAYICSSFVVGKFLDQAEFCAALKHKRCSLTGVTLTLGLALTGTGTVLLGLTSNWPVCLIGRAMQGLGGAAVEVAAMVLVSQVFPEHRLAAAEGWLETGTGLGYAAGMPVGGLVYGYVNLFWAFAVGAIICFAALLISLRLVMIDTVASETEKDISDDASSAEAIHIIHRLVPMGALLFVFGSLMGVLSATLAIHDEQRFHLGPARIGSLLLMVAAAYIVFCPLVGRICEGPVGLSKRCIAAGLLLGSVAYGLLSADTSVYLQALSLFVLGSSEAMVLIPSFPVMLDAAGGKSESVSGIVSAALNTSYYAGECAGPWLSLVLVDVFGFPAAMSIQGTIMCIAFVCFVGSLSFKFGRDCSEQELHAPLHVVEETGSS